MDPKTFVDKCRVCSSQLSFVTNECPTCGQINPYPNVRFASWGVQVAALEARFAVAETRARSEGYYDRFAEFVNAVKDSVATCTFSLREFERLVLSENELAGTFMQKVSGNLRLASELDQYDRKRFIVEAILFPGYGNLIRYAALSLDGHGLTRYGDVTVTLDEIHVSHRSTVFQENSVFYFDRRSIDLGSPLEPGFLARWEDRHKLAAAKLGTEIGGLRIGIDFRRLLMRSFTDGTPDDFLEVHIHGPFSANSFTSFCKCSELLPDEEVRYERLVDTLASRGIHESLPDFEEGAPCM